MTADQGNRITMTEIHSRQAPKRVPGGYFSVLPGRHKCRKPVRYLSSLPLITQKVVGSNPTSAITRIRRDVTSQENAYFSISPSIDEWINGESRLGYYIEGLGCHLAANKG